MAMSSTLHFTPGAHPLLDRLAAAPPAGPIAGIDEAGRGPWAGPVVAAAVILDPDGVPNGLNDSKKLTAAERETLFTAIQTRARVGLGIVDVNAIDRLNILGATLKAMADALAQLSATSGPAPVLALVDGNRPPSLPCPVSCIIKGDGLCPAIAAASIMAKVTRDRIMMDLARDYPGYGWDTNMGYGTKAHRLGLDRLGPTPHHRRSFKPVAAYLADMEASTEDARHGAA